MGLLTRLREWFAGLLGGPGPDDADDADGPVPETGDNDGSVEEPGEGDGDGGLDPTAVTETRSDATDDAVDALRNVRESGPAADADGDDPDETGEDDPIDRDGMDGPEPDPPGDDAKD
ncbi:hypothetical protein J2751_002589 [Halorubrum alkaliphilum]|uniref:Uncharacterized protein n=1 Tax=Halorubrum alkaliphilum TaxID=261290 RepID=A0A8T4GH52_9EURY|nr:hypothetical protein [Halorubrum alkaliphilum]MBP1923546.1 hypothetical protein [Halorubrum alkaliphilum]